MIDRDKFFADGGVLTLFRGNYSRGQAAGLNAILDEWEARADFTDLRWLAYMLATAFHETARTMKPIEEYGRGRGRAYGEPDAATAQIYYGRGYVQLTWKTNYAKMAALTGVDRVNHPELALVPRLAALIMFEGMKGGLFTRVGLDRYFNPTLDDPVNARRIINGADHAEEIAAIHAAFLKALS